MTGIINRKEFNSLRKELRTKAPKCELILWQKLKGKQVHGQKFRRQASIERYVVDFYCSRLRLAIEIDGGSHSATADLERKDKERQESIEKLGIEFLRFGNWDIYHNIDNVLNVIYERVGELTSLNPLLRKEGAE